MSLTELPQAEGPEKSVLSAMLAKPEFVARAKAEGLTPEHFSLKGRALLFAALIEKPDLAADHTAFLHDANRRGMLDAIGGPSGFVEILTYAPGGHHWTGHTRILRETLARRRVVEDALAMIDSAPSAEPGEISSMLAKASERAADALQEGVELLCDAKTGVQALLGQMRALCEDGDKLPGIPTGMDSIDLATGGMRPGQLWVVAGETSGGKSVWLLQAAAQTLAAGRRVFVASLEMQSAEIIARLASCHGSLPYGLWSAPRQHKLRLANAKRALEEISEWPVIIDDRAGRTVSEIAATAELVATTHGGLDLVVVDYLQLVTGERRHRGDSREREIADVSANLKILAKKLGCPVITASQLNDNGRLRESRAIGHAADVVLKIEEDGIRGNKIRNGVRNQLFPLTLRGEIQRFETSSNDQLAVTNHDPR